MGIDNPHPWLLEPTSIHVMGDSCLNSYTASEKRCAGIVGHTSLIIRLTVTSNEMKSKQEKHVFKYGYMLKISKPYYTSFYKQIFRFQLIVKLFQTWFLIGKNYILQIENTGFSTNKTLMNSPTLC